MNAVEHNRLKWKCRRGLLELDLVLQRFMGKGALSAAELASLNCLLELPDNDLWEIISGRSDAYDARFAGVVAWLRAA
ncbi:MAG: FAD assembly factor SdhE [Betaproteobacteria bacterium]